MRALRVGKTTLAILETACSYYLNDKDLFEYNVLFKTLNTSVELIKQKAEELKLGLQKKNIESEIVASKGKYGEPNEHLGSFLVRNYF